MGLCARMCDLVDAVMCGCPVVVVFMSGLADTAQAACLVPAAVIPCDVPAGAHDLNPQTR